MYIAAPPLPAVLLKPIQSFAERAHLLSLPLHAYQIVAAFVIYEVIFLFASPALSATLLPETYRRLSHKTKLNWNVRVVSFIQATFISTLAIYVIYSDGNRRRIDWEERLWGYTASAGNVQAYAAGYFLWDTLVSAQYLNVTGPGALAHAISALIITMIGFRPFANFYGLNFILYELSTPFLNIHWYLDKLNMTGSKAQLYNGIVLMGTFFSCRIIWGFYQSFRLYSDAWSAWKTGTIDPAYCRPSLLLEEFSPLTVNKNVDTACALPFWILVTYVLGNTLLSFLNCYWFGKMIEAFKKRFDVPQNATANSKDKDK